MLHIFISAGPVMYPLLASSIIVMTVIIERIFFWIGKVHRLTSKKARIIENANLVTEIKPVKHYFQKGVPTRLGIEK